MRLEYFQLIDKIIDIDIDGRKIRAEAVVPTASTIFEGHFPSQPLMPGVLLLEAMAQTAGWLIIGLTKFTRMPYLVAFKEAKLRSFVTPGTVLGLGAEIVHEGSGYTVTKAEIRVEGKPVCDLEIIFRLVPFPSPEFRAGMEKIASVVNFPMKTLAHG